MDLTERFLKYVSFPTMSDGDSKSCPSTPGQLVLGKYLAEELAAMGAKNAHMDENGYVYAEIPANCEKPQPVIGFIAHMDTASECSGENIHPSVVLFDGAPVVLNEKENIVLSPEDFPHMLAYKGKHLIVTDGTTLLGADDKAGVAEIMDMAERLLTSDIPHGEIRIGFTPDEEIGRGADRFDIPGFGADFAYTVDGGELGGIEYECFNAASAKVSFHGKSIHPGSAKGKMKNSMKMAIDFQTMLPADQAPEFTEGYEGFYHLVYMEGSVEETTLAYILRDHDSNLLEEKKQTLLSAGEAIDRMYGAGSCKVELRDSYRNMKEYVLPHPEVLDRARSAMRSLGIDPVSVPIRGGTDGATLSLQGLPCPNLCTGGENCHGRFEFAVAEDMKACADILLNIAKAE